MRTHVHDHDADGAGSVGSVAWQLPLLLSDLVVAPFAHGFSTRAGGTSPPPFDSLNLGAKWGDAAATVAENRRRLASAVGVAGPIYVARQVHGAGVAVVRAGDDPALIAATEADALCSDDAHVALAVFVADCVPALIVDPRSGAVAAVHAGWRGTVAGVLPAAVRALADRFGAHPGDLRVALGPSIGRCCFEVGADVVAAFASALAGAPASDADAGAGVVQVSPRGVPDKWHVDLRLANRLLLEGAGVAPDAIDASADCTHCDGARFYSYRRDRDRTGQQMGVVVRAG
jgi:polyphenol oxidase